MKLSAYKEKFHHTFQHFSDILHQFVRRSYSELLSAYNRAESTISSLERRLQSVSNLQSAMNSEKIELSKSLAEKEEHVVGFLSLFFFHFEFFLNNLALSFYICLFFFDFFFSPF